MNISALMLERFLLSVIYKSIVRSSELPFLLSDLSSLVSICNFGKYYCSPMNNEKSSATRSFARSIVPVDVVNLLIPGVAIEGMEEKLKLFL